jgi:hypothetical protein
MLGSLAAIGQIPCRQRFHGKHIGWLKADILEWMGRSPRPPIAKTSNRAHCARFLYSNPDQHVLPLRPALRGDRSTFFIPGVSP